MTEVVDPSFKHPRCYLNRYGGCSPTISGEHYVSHSLIRLYGGEKAMITPLPPYGMSGPVRGTKFVANVLCREHNRMLHSADDAALAFATPLKAVSDRFHSPAGWGLREVHQVDGLLLERWALKLLLTHAASKRFTAGSERIEIAASEIAVDLLLGRAQWPVGWGLSVGPHSGNTHLPADILNPLVRTTFWGANPFVARKGSPCESEGLCGGVVELAGVGFALCLCSRARSPGDTAASDSVFYRTRERPASLTWTLDAVDKIIEFDWGPGGVRHPGVVYGYT